MAGHSKWAQIKHKKALSDAKKGQLFSRLAREITIAARSGASPETNSQLRGLVERARSAGLPKENIERAILRASKKEVDDLQEFLFEATAPGGINILIEGITDNKNRTTAELRHLLSEHGAKLADPGSILWNFDKIGVIEIVQGENQSPPDTIELAIMESGASEFKKTGDVWLVETSFVKLDSVRRSLESQGVAVYESGHDYKARLGIRPPEELRHPLEILIEALLSREDVRGVYTNMEPK